VARRKAVDFHMLVDLARRKENKVNHPIYGRGAVLDEQRERESSKLAAIK